MKPSLEHLTGHRIHTLEAAIKDLSLGELESLAGIMSQKSPRIFRAKLDLVKREIRGRKSPVISPAVYGIIGFSG